MRNFVAYSYLIKINAQKIWLSNIHDLCTHFASSNFQVLLTTLLTSPLDLGQVSSLTKCCNCLKLLMIYPDPDTLQQNYCKDLTFLPCSLSLSRLLLINKSWPCTILSLRSNQILRNFFSSPWPSLSPCFQILSFNYPLFRTNIFGGKFYMGLMFIQVTLKTCGASIILHPAFPE